MKRKRSIVLIGVSVLVGVVGSGFPAKSSAQAQAIKVGGTGGAMGMMHAFAEAFKKTRPAANVIVVPALGSGGGRRALSAGSLDIAVTSTPGKDPEQLAGAIPVLLGRTPFVFAASRTNAAANALTTHELVEIWSGKRVAWPDGSRLRLILRPEGDSDTAVLKAISPAMEQAVKAALAREGMKIAVTDTDAADAIETIQGALGTSSLSLLLSEKRPLKVLPLNGVAPSVKTIADGSYPLFKSTYVLTSAQPSELTKDFLAFLRSPTGRQILARSGHWLGHGDS